MTTDQIATELVSLCRKNENLKAIQTLYSPNIVSVEAMEMPNMPREMKGLDAILKKNQWWLENHEVHSAVVSDPFVSPEKFAVTFAYEVTAKMTGHRHKMSEVAVYTVADGKIVREEFLYARG